MCKFFCAWLERAPSMVRGGHGFTAETALIGEDAKALIFEGNAGRLLQL